MQQPAVERQLPAGRDGDRADPAERFHEQAFWRPVRLLDGIGERHDQIDEQMIEQWYAHFEAMLHESWRVLKPGGLFFCRLGSSIGMESRIEHIEGRRYKSPDGSERYLVDEALLGSITERLGGELADPLKTTVVQNQRSMTTWVLRKKPL